MVGVIGYGAYIPRLRMQRAAIAEANSWYAPNLVARAKGALALANWDEDSITLATAAARDCLGDGDDRSRIGSVFLASTTLPFVERLNAGVIVEALTLNSDVDALEFGGSQRAALSALSQAILQVRHVNRSALVVAADKRKAQPASPQELVYGDGAAAILVGEGEELAVYLGGAVSTLDFVDHFRGTGQSFDYVWEERWIRDEGVIKVLPPVVANALASAGVSANEVDHFIFPTAFSGLDQQVAKRCGIRPEAVTANLFNQVGDIGVAHPLLLLTDVLSKAEQGQIIVVGQFGSGAQVMVFRTTERIGRVQPARGLAMWIARGSPETRYTKFLSFKNLLDLESGPRGEQDRKTALSTANRHRRTLLGLVGGRCSVTGKIHFPPSRLSYDQDAPLLDTQEPYKLAERHAKILSWSEEFLSHYRAPPHTYGQVDFEGGGRILMEFTDIAPGEIQVGVDVEMTFRIKDIDERRGFSRYFWKATPIDRPSHNQPV